MAKIIDHVAPNLWKDLQNKTRNILKICGFETEIEKKIKLVRGNKVVDVYAIDKNQSPPITYLCECKYWKKKVPQEVVHSFRTVVNDYGANFGLIISSMGFQKGAILASFKTNVKLLDWYEFQEIFFDRWMNSFTKRIMDKQYPIIYYTEPMNSGLFREAEKLSPYKFKKFKKLRREYEPIANLMFSIEFKHFRLDFPQKTIIDNETNLQKEFYSAIQLFAFIIRKADEGIGKFDALFGKRMVSD